MTGTIVGLVEAQGIGTICAADGCVVTFSELGLLGDFQSLALGQRVTFELDQRRKRVAVRVFPEPDSRKHNAPGETDLRYTGFRQKANLRVFQFEIETLGRPCQQFVVTADMGLLAKHGVGLQEAPALCLQKLTRDLHELAGVPGHELSEADMLAFVKARKAAAVRRKPVHAFHPRRGTPPPALNQ